MEYLRGLLGLVVLVGIAYAFSKDRKAISWRLVGTGILLQIIFALLVLRIDAVATLFESVGNGFVRFLSFSEAGARFLFGDLAVSYPSNARIRRTGWG
jgi:CNT family concentrative nucleoside transporter